MRFVSLALLALALVLVLAAVPVAAQDARDARDARERFQLELVASLIFGDDIEEDDFGLRGAYRPSDRWSFETRLSQAGSDSLDLWLVDVSARWHFDRRGRSRWYLSAGPGIVVEDFDDVFDPFWLIHVGIGTEIELTPNLFLRPELLARANENFDTVAGDLNLGIGWRF